MGSIPQGRTSVTLTPFPGQDGLDWQFQEGMEQHSTAPLYPKRPIQGNPKERGAYLTLSPSLTWAKGKSHRAGGEAMISREQAQL